MKNNKVLLLPKKNTDRAFEQTKSRPQETLEYKLNKQKEVCSFNPPINLFEEGKWWLAATSFEATNSVFNITNENISFLNSTPGHCFFRGSVDTTNRLQKFLELRSQNDIELHVKQVENRGSIIAKDLSFSELDTHKKRDNRRNKSCRISSRVVSRADGGGLKTLCIKIGYSEPSQAESREGSSTVTESSRVT